MENILLTARLWSFTTAGVEDLSWTAVLEVVFDCTLPHLKMSEFELKAAILLLYVSGSFTSLVLIKKIELRYPLNQEER